MEATFTARIWRYDGPGGWRFVTVPRDVSEEMHTLAAGRAKAFGSVRVTALTGRTRWKTSVFWDRKRAAYLLPVKAKVRESEQLRDGDEVEVTLAPEFSRQAG